MPSGRRHRVLHHAAQRLGEVEHVRSEDPDGRPLPFDLACLRDLDEPGLRSHLTLGLNEHDLGAGPGTRGVRHEELLLVAREPVPVGAPPEVLRAVGELAVERHLAVRPGAVLGPAGVGPVPVDEVDVAWCWPSWAAPDRGGCRRRAREPVGGA